MANFQDTLNALQPYVIGIRYLEGQPLVDAVFKEDWVLPDDKRIKKIKGNEEVNYYMIYSETLGVDELLQFVSKTIKLNEEREKKHELLKIKINELKEIFKNNPLSKLKELKFSFNEEDLIPNLSELDITAPTDSLNLEEEPIKENVFTESESEDDEEAEILAEELRAEKNRRYQKDKVSKIANLPNNLDLPPKKNPIVSDQGCTCGPNEACHLCIDSKDY
jgi:hypothetical protein